MRTFTPLTNLGLQAALNSEVDEPKPAAAGHLLGNDAAMTVSMIALKAEEACHSLRGGIQSVTHIGLRD